MRAAKRALGVSSFDSIRGRYVGLRPGARDQSDYIIKRDGARVTVAGIRSTGLTASLAIGERALGLVEEVLSAYVGELYGMDRVMGRLFAALDAADLAAPYDYFTGGVLALRPGRQDFASTLAEDAGRYVSRRRRIQIVSVNAPPRRR